MTQILARVRQTPGAALRVTVYQDTQEMENRATVGKFSMSTTFV